MSCRHCALLALVVGLLAAAGGASTPTGPMPDPVTPPDEDLQMCTLAPAAEEADVKLPAAEPLQLDSAPAGCPVNRRCTAFCPEYPGCPLPQCINNRCVYE